MMETEANPVNFTLNENKQADFMQNESFNENHTQADFIQDELNFDIDVNDPLTKASLSDHPVDEWMDILGNDQLKKKVIKAGIPSSRPNRSDLCTIKMVGKLEDGTIIEEEEEVTIQLGDMEVIQGLDLALALMDVEEEAEIEISPRFAYGTIGRTPIESFPEIPPHSRLIYYVTLKNVKIEPDIEELTYHERRKIGNKKRERGNWWFSRNESSLAIQCYKKALQYLAPYTENDPSDENKCDQSTEPISNADLQAILEDGLKVYNNLAAAHLKVQAYDAALQSVDNVLKCQPYNVKALYRKGKILHHKGEHAKACTVLSQALKIEPDNKAIQQELAVLKKKSAKDAHHEKNLYRKMLGTSLDKKSNSKSKKHKKVSKQITWSIIGGSVVALAGYIAYKFVS